MWGELLRGEGIGLALETMPGISSNGISLERFLGESWESGLLTSRSSRKLSPINRQVPMHQRMLAYDVNRLREPNHFFPAHGVVFLYNEISGKTYKFSGRCLLFLRMGMRLCLKQL